jgi:hypothetical protein
MTIRWRRERGALMGLVLVLLAAVLMASGLALWSVRSDSASAGADRLERQLFDCAEQGLEWGKQYFSSTGSNWSQSSGGFLGANTVCTSGGRLPCPPFHQGTITPPDPNYPNGAPFTKTLTIGGQTVAAGSTSLTTATQTFQYTVGIYDNDDEATATQDYLNDNDQSIVVYSICVDTATSRSKSVSAVIKVQIPTNNDYSGQAGFGFRNQGNQN